MRLRVLRRLLNVKGVFFSLIPKKIMHLCIMHSKELFKGTLKTLVLHLLQAEGRMYGYQITQRVKSLSEGELILTEGALYPTLHKLEKAGLIISEKERVGGRIRKYYLLSDLGTVSATDYLNEFRNFVQTMNRIFQLKLD